MTTRMVHIYALEYDDRAYVGSALDPTVRLRAHVEGHGAKCTRRWVQEITPALPDFKELGVYPEGDRTSAEQAWYDKYAWGEWGLINGRRPGTLPDGESLRQGARKMYEINKANGWKAQRIGIRKVHEINKVNGYEAQRRGARNQPLEVRRQIGRKWSKHPDHREWAIRGGHLGGRNQSMEAKRWGLRRAHEINKANNYADQRQGLHRMHEINKASGYEAQRQGVCHAQRANRSNGYEAQRWGIRKIPLETVRMGGRKGAHVRWHVDRNVVNSDCAFCRES